MRKVGSSGEVPHPRPRVVTPSGARANEGLAIVSVTALPRPKLRPILLVLVALATLLTFGAQSAEARHFRYGNLSWDQTGNGARIADFSYTAAFRRSAYGGSDTDGQPKPGDIIDEFVGARASTSVTAPAPGSCATW